MARRKPYSRLVRTEEKKNIRRAYFFIVLTIVLLVILWIVGLPALAKFAAILTDLRTSALPVEKTDNTPPAPPRLSNLPEATNEFTVEIRGNTEPGVTVVLFLNNKQEEILASSNGEFSYSFSLRDGENSVKATSRDSAGNISQESDVHKIVFDNEPPTLEITSPENGSKFYGTKQRQVVIEGRTEPDVNVRINDRYVAVEEDGTFTFATTLTEGENQFNVKAEDNAGNATESSLTLSFSL